MARLLPGRILVAGQPESATLPVGSLIPIMAGLTGVFVPAATGVVKEGWQLADGAAVAAGQLMTGENTPDTSDSRFLMGSTSAGTTGGSNTLIDHTHGFSLTAAAQTVNSLTAAGQGGGSVAITSSGSHGHTVNAPTKSVGTNTNIGSQAGIVDTNSTATISGTGAHTHTVPAHTHSSSSVTGTMNSSSVSGSVGSGSGATSTNSRPLYVSVVYLIKVS